MVDCVFSTPWEFEEEEMRVDFETECADQRICGVSTELTANLIGQSVALRLYLCDCVCPDVDRSTTGITNLVIVRPRSALVYFITRADRVCTIVEAGHTLASQVHTPIGTSCCHVHRTTNTYTSIHLPWVLKERIWVGSTTVIMWS